MELHLTETDKKVLTLLYYNRFLSSKQIQRIFYNTQKQGNLIARRRMNKMLGDNKAKYKLINEYIPFENNMKVYSLNDIGTAYITGFLNIPNTYKKETWQDVGRIEHALDINDFYINLLEYGKGSINTFLVERHNRRQFNFNSKQYIIIPDVFFVYTEPNKKGKAYFVEVDRNTEAPKKFAMKIPVYEAYYQIEILKEDWQPEQKVKPVIIILCDTEERIKRLKAVCKTNLPLRFHLKNDIKGVLE